MEERKLASDSTADGGCPMMKHSKNVELNTIINPDNQMPFAETLQEEPIDATGLSTDRESSSIPRADTNSTWQYPSARMFYNALQRRGKGVPTTDIDSMLNVHNALNEAVWEELVAMEKQLAPQCEPRLVRFMGRPEEWSPRAWWHVRIRGGEAPFDRHDWIVDRCGCELRYVIDYYSGHPEEGQATFNVDIRPALDSPQACLDRFRLFWNKHIRKPHNEQSSSQLQ